MSDDRRRTYGIDGGDDMKGIITSEGGYIYNTNTDTIVNLGSVSQGGVNYCAGKSIISRSPSNLLVGVLSDLSSYQIPNGTDLNTLSAYVYNGSQWVTSNKDAVVYSITTGDISYLSSVVHEDAMTGFKFTMIRTFYNKYSYNGVNQVYQVDDSMCIASYIGSYSEYISVYQAGSETEGKEVHKMNVVAVYNGYAYVGGPENLSPSYKLYRYNYMTGESSVCGGGSTFYTGSNSNTGGISIC